ncbi:hypothetical protein L0P85_08860 [Terrisporobacter glycolicus]|nr:hypothetical protein L0P85_08860 [Terrisporobacter glycolicus]
MKNIFITGDIRIGKSTVIKKVLDSNKTILGVLKKKNCSLINDIKKRDDLLLLEVDKSNRDFICKDIYKAILDLL